MPDEVTLLSSDVPDAFLAEIAARLHSHTVALLKVTVDAHGNERAYQIGSGTLISIENVSGVLTASHVAKQLDGPCWLGMTIAREGEAHAYKIDKNYLHTVEITASKSIEYGPDITFIQLANPDIGTIKARKSFHPLLPDQAEMLSSPPPMDFGMWFMCGAPGEKTSVELFDAGFGESIVFQLDCGLCAIENEYRQNDYDYLEALVEYRDRTYAPKTFGGMSGGGLWQIIFAQLPDGQLVVRRVHFAGVLFYESPLERQKRLIRCHGRYSIYKHTIDTIRSKCT